jgi:hypothetical protein
VFDGGGDKPTRRQVFEVDGIVTKEFSGKPPGLERPAFVAERDEAVFQYYSSVF